MTAGTQLLSQGALSATLSAGVQTNICEAISAMMILNSLLSGRAPTITGNDLADPAWPVAALVRDAVGILATNEGQAQLSQAILSAVSESGRLKASATGPSQQLKDIITKGLQVRPSPRLRLALPSHSCVQGSGDLKALSDQANRFAVLAALKTGTPTIPKLTIGGNEPPAPNPTDSAVTEAIQFRVATMQSQLEGVLLAADKTDVSLKDLNETVGTASRSVCAAAFNVRLCPPFIFLVLTFAGGRGIRCVRSSLRRSPSSVEQSNTSNSSPTLCPWRRMRYKTS